MPDPCSYLSQTGSALPPGMTDVLPAGSVGLPTAPPDWTNRIRFTNFDTIKVVGNITGSALTTAATAAGTTSTYPNAFLISRYQFTTPCAVFLFSLACSLTSVAAGNVGVFCAKSNSTSLYLGTGPIPFSILDVVTQANSVANFPNPVSRNVQLQLGEGTAMRFDAGDTLALFACGPNDAATLINALLTVYYVVLSV
jgi:hypothetical protein